jgi:2-dehydro-3-deoxyphosphogluconate aldolase/(4S)-4-hydroxy-2-oxoglutarate aldolase
MGKDELSRELGRARLVAVVRSGSSELALETATAAAAGGVKFVEITFSVPDALEVIKSLAQRADLHVGAGTVLSKEKAEQAIQAGAEFIVSPALELDLIPVCHEANIPCFPAAATPTEIVAAARAGADLVKIFPADLLGGVDFIRQMRGPFPEIHFMVSGGVNRNNVKAYVQAGVIGICLSSSHLAQLLAEQGKNGLAAEIRGFVKLVAEAQRELRTPSEA